MKIKIQDPNLSIISHLWIFYLYIFIFLLIFIPLFLKDALSWAAYNQVAREICEGDGIICLLAAKALPWAALALLGVSFHLIYKAFFSADAKRNRVRTLELRPEGVKLEYTQQTLPVLLPYAETQFVLTVKCATVSTQHNTFPIVRFCDFSFLQGDKSYSFRHAQINPFSAIIKLLGTEHAFKKFELKVEPLSEKYAHLPGDNPLLAEVEQMNPFSDNRAVEIIRTRLEDFRKYGLICRFSDTMRSLLMYFSFIFLFAWGSLAVLAYVLRDFIMFCCFLPFLVLALCFFIPWYKDNRIAKQLAHLKGKK